MIGITGGDVLMTDGQVRSVIDAQFADIEAGAITRLSEGEDYYTFDVDDTYVFRFPKKQSVSLKLQREIKLLSEIGPALPVETPEFLFHGQPSSLFPYFFAGHKKVRGIAGEELRPPITAWPTLAQQFGAFLSSLHSLTDQIVERYELNFQCIDTPDETLSQVLETADIVRRNFPNLVRSDVEQYLSGDVRVPKAQPIIVLAHADIKGEHIIISPSGDRLRGVIDWSDLCLTDAVDEFGGLMIWLGPRFVKQVLSHYTVAVDPDFYERMRFYSQCSVLINLGKPNGPIELLVAQAKSAFDLW